MKVLQIGGGNIGLPIYNNTKNHYKNATLITKSNGGLEGLKKQIFDIIVLAIKPQQFAELAPQINNFTDGNTIIVSIMAAVEIKTLAKHIANRQNFVRIMPNLGVKLASGGVNLVYNCVKNTKMDAFIENVFGGKNIVLNLSDEKQIDELTPITGCGIAYFLLLAKIMQNKSSLGKNIIRSLINNAFELSQNNEFNEVIAQIASKSGVTEAAIKAMQSDIANGLQQGINAGLKKIEDLREVISSGVCHPDESQDLIK